MPRRSPFEIVLTEDEEQALRSMTSKYTLPYFQVLRAKMILLAAEGVSNKEIAEHLHVGRDVVSKWRKRFFEEGLPALCDQPRPGRPAAFSPSDRGGGKSAGV